MNQTPSKNAITIVLPRFGNGFCTAFTACAQVSGEGVKDIKAQSPLRFRYRSGGYSGYINAFFKKSSGNHHLHIDVLSARAVKAAGSEFGDEFKTNSTQKHFEKFLAQFFGMTANVGIQAHFEAPKSQLRHEGAITMLAPQALDEKQGLQSRSTGYEVTSASPKMKLNFYDVEDLLIVNLDVEFETLIEPGYLEIIQKIMNGIFNHAFYDASQEPTNAESI